MPMPQHKNYHGLRYARHEIAKMIPENTMLFVEPFGGHAWVSKEVCGKKAKICVIGDINPEAINWVKNKQKIMNAILKVQDWKKTVKETDSPNTFFLFDPPWNNRRCTVNSPNPGACGKDYYNEIIETAKKLKGKSIITFPLEKANEICPKIKKCIKITKTIGKRKFNYGIGIIK